MPARHVPPIRQSPDQIELFRTIGENIRNRREQLDMYQRELADRIGISQSVISRFESSSFRNSVPRRYRPSLEMLVALARVLKCHASDFLLPGRFGPVQH